MLEMFVLYENPSDFPGRFVVRRWVSRRGTPAATADRLPLIVTDTLDMARAVIPQGATCIGRYLEDDPAIREVWL